MGIFNNLKDFEEYEITEDMPILAYSRLMSSIIKHHDLRRYRGSELICKHCMHEVGFLVYSRQITCTARTEAKPKKRWKKSFSGGVQGVTEDDFSLQSCN